MSKDFRRHGSHKLKRLSTSWRKPRGLHNKVRLEHKGYVRKVKIGCSKGTTPLVTIITSLRDLENTTAKEVVFSAKLGAKKRISLLEEAKKKGITVTNVPDNYAEVVSQRIKERKKASSARVERRTTKQKELEKKKPKKEEKPLDDEEKKKLAKQEKDKVLTQGE